MLYLSFFMSNSKMWMKSLTSILGPSSGNSPSSCSQRTPISAESTTRRWWSTIPRSTLYHLTSDQLSISSKNGSLSTKQLSLISEPVSSEKRRKFKNSIHYLTESLSISTPKNKKGGLKNLTKRKKTSNRLTWDMGKRMSFTNLLFSSTKLRGRLLVFLKTSVMELTIWPSWASDLPWKESH